MRRFLVLVVALLVILLPPQRETSGQVALTIPTRVNGVELSSVRGWLANIYPWTYVPEVSTVHPVLRLWTPKELQTPFQIWEQSKQLNDYGSGADVLEYSPNPGLGDHNHWLRTYFTNGSRPFFLLYEHINGTRFDPPHNDAKNMDLPHNRKVFKEDIDFMFRNVIIPYQSRYITVNGRAVIYMWASSAMTGDFVGLLEEVKANYPVFFIGTRDHENTAKVLDGFMDYSLGPGSGDYLQNVQNYRQGSFSWRQFLRKLESETGKKYLFIPTFQAAYDDTKFPGRTSPPMYPRSKEEIEYHAELIKTGMGLVYDKVGPFVVYSELPEGASVIESQCTSETANRPGRWTGCGTGRLEVLKKHFSSVGGIQ